MRSYQKLSMSLILAVAFLCQGVSFAETATVVSASVQKKKASLFRHRSYPAAWTAAQESNRPILIYVTMPQCPHCVKMIEQTFKRPAVGKLVSGSFETICADRYTHAKLVEKLQVKWYPTTVLVTPNNKVLDVIEGYVEPAKFKQQLQTGLAAAGPSSQTR